MAPYAPAPTKGFTPIDLSFGKKKLINSISGANDIADTPKKISTPNATYDWKTAPSPFTPQNAPKTIGALFGAGTTTGQTTPLQVNAPSSPQPNKAVDNSDTGPLPFFTEAANASEAHPMNLFSDEQTAFNKMKADNIPEEQAYQAIREHRLAIIGKESGLSQDETTAMQKMQQDGMNSSDAVQALQDYRKANPVPVEKKNDGSIHDQHSDEGIIGQGLKAVPRGIVDFFSGFGHTVADTALNGSSAVLRGVNDLNQMVGSSDYDPNLDKNIKDTTGSEGIGGDIARATGAGSQVLSDVYAPGMNIGFNVASEAPGTQYVTQGIGKAFDSAAQKISDETGIEKGTVASIGQTIMNAMAVKGGIASKGTVSDIAKNAGNKASLLGAVGSVASDIASTGAKTVLDIAKTPYNIAKSGVKLAVKGGNAVGDTLGSISDTMKRSQKGVPEGSFRNLMGDIVPVPGGPNAGFMRVPGKGYTEGGERIDLPEQTISDKIEAVKSPTSSLDKENALGVTPLSRIAAESVKMGNAGSSAPELMRKMSVPFQGLSTVWDLVRTGKLEGNLDTMSDTGKAILDGLNKYGKVIGEIRQKSSGETMDTRDIASKAEGVLTSPEKTIQTETGYARLQNYYDDLNRGAKNFDDIFKLKSRLGGELLKMQKAGQASDATYGAMRDMNEALGQKIDTYLENGKNIQGEDLARYKEAMDVYSKLKNVAVPFLKSASIDLQRSNTSPFETLALRDFIDPKTIAVKMAGKAVSDMYKSQTTREGAMKRFFNGMDRMAQERVPKAPDVPNPDGTTNNLQNQ